LQDGRHSRVPGGRYQARLRGGPGVPGWCRLGRDEDAAPAGRLSAAAPVRGCRSGGGLPATEGAGDNLGLFSVLYWCRYFLRLFIEDRARGPGDPKPSPGGASGVAAEAMTPTPTTTPTSAVTSGTPELMSGIAKLGGARARRQPPREMSQILFASPPAAANPRRGVWPILARRRRRMAVVRFSNVERTALSWPVETPP